MKEGTLKIRKGKRNGISSFTLHILAIVFMTCDHLWGTDLLGGCEALTCIGRLTFPIYAFMIAEGYYYTKDFKKYLKRLLIVAFISEIPYNLMTESTVFFPFGQNVLWTFILALLCMKSVDKVRANKNKIVGWLLASLVVVGFYLAATLTMVDYMGDGLLMVIVFHIFRGEKWYHKLLQTIAMFYINFEMMKGFTYEWTVFGYDIAFPRQGFAVLALVPIFLYKGNQGPKNKVTKYIFYAYYPAHILLLLGVKFIINKFFLL